MKPDVLSVIECAYRLECDPATWLRDVAAAAYEQIGAGHGLVGFQYRVSEEGRLQIGEALEIAMPAGVAPQMRATLEQMPPDFVRRSFVRCEAATQSQAGDATAREHARVAMEGLTAAFGWRDIFMLGGMDPTGHGVYLGAWLPRVTKLAARTRATFSRVAVHVVTAHRLRRRLGQDGGLLADTADAIVTPGGRIDHARGEAEPRQARAALREAVLEVERARGRLRKAEPDQAVDAWKGLVAGRWTLVDRFESDGKRYVLARRNDVPMAGSEGLTERELQALGYAALGHANKLIAYEMGIAASTVGVLLHRAARKLGAGDRQQLLTLYMAGLVQR